MFNKFKLTVNMKSGRVHVIKTNDEDGLSAILEVFTKAFKDPTWNGELNLKGLKVRLSEVESYQLKDIAWF